MRQIFASLILAVMVFFAVAVPASPSPVSINKTPVALATTFDFIRADWKPNRADAVKTDLPDNFRPHRIFQHSPPVFPSEFSACDEHPAEVFKEVVYKNRNSTARRE